MERLYIIIIVFIIVDFLIIVLFLRWRKKKIDQIIRDLKFSGEAFILGPEKASFRGATAQYGRVKGNGMLCLTREKIIFIPLVGNHIVIPLQDIKDVSECKRFLGQYVGKPMMVIHGAEADAGFIVGDIGRWLNSIRNAMK